jgi:hypothetical protein
MTEHPESKDRSTSLATYAWHTKGAQQLLLQGHLSVESTRIRNKQRVFFIFPLGKADFLQ